MQTKEHQSRHSWEGNFHEDVKVILSVGIGYWVQLEVS